MGHRYHRVGALLAGGLILAACGSSYKASSTSSTTSSTTSAPSYGSGATTGGTAPTGAAVDVASNPLGQILVDDQGMTLYIFMNDTPGTSTCVNNCAVTWPPLDASTVAVGSGLAASDFSLVARADGTQQLAVNGHPLYRFAGDSKAGETTGQGFNNVWYVAGSNGQPIGAPTTGTGASG
jgi:predicted lipoprotein with Yx(FWY)xxD motif